MSLVEAFRFPFYRIFFSVVVGIIALEGFVLSYNQKENDKKLQVIDGVLIRVIESDSTKELPLPGQIEIPFTVKKFKKSKNQSAEFDIRFSRLTESVAPKIKFTGGFVIKDDPILVLENRPDIVIGNHWVFLKFKSWNIIVLTIYLLIAGIVGEFLCTLGDLLVGMCFFGFNPYSCDNDLEYCRPDYIKDKILKYIRECVGKKNNNQKKNSSDRSNDTKDNNNKIVKISSILRNNPMITDFSELHFSLSRVYAGLFLTTLVLVGGKFIPYSLLLLITIIALIIVTLIGCFISKKSRFLPILLCCLAILLVILVTLFITFKNELLGTFTLSFLSFISLLLSIIFRTQANRIIIQRAQEEQQN